MNRWLAAILLLSVAGCRVGPNYKRPAPPTMPAAFKEPPPVNFKEAEAAGWTKSQPGDAFLKGKWWEVYNDPALNALEEQVAISNQNVLQAEAQYRQAQAAVRVARAALFPAAATSASATRSGNGGSSSGAAAGAVGLNSSTPGGGSNSGSARTLLNLPFNVSWEPDVWGDIRRNVAANTATAQALEADLENARLLYQSELAQDFFQLHGLDGQADLLRRVESDYEQSLALTRARVASGVATDLDVAQAETQLYGVQAQLMDLGVQRAQLEHAIAILTGKPPAEVTIPQAALAILPPPVPVGVPSELLQRRPDIAASERMVAAANEQIGIAIAAFYPHLTLTATGGLEATSLAKWFTWPARFWSVGPQLAETLFDAGRRRGVVAEDRAAYDATVAQYRETVLTSMQQVEDDLAALRILEGESSKVQQTVDAANHALMLANAQYQAGTVDYLTVIASQAAALNSEASLVTLRTRRLTASVLLIEALGGGWDTSKLPSEAAIVSGK